eukprot:TRINITY_DN21723_c0_g1_i1.p1 TRINITY_DN21723_c0_g1~~TRINITY_DN21723_c0_g1_i1.p1  ORF type:complete len:331 (+),score=36.73 TRINITY_DN21723_c0_g1_i1:106-1098(+)
MQEAVLGRLAALESQRQRLEDDAATPSELMPISKADLEELRRLSRPPQTVRACLELVYMLLNVDQVSEPLRGLPADGRLDVRWPTVQAMLARFDTFFPSMQQYDIAPLIANPHIMRYLSRVYFSSDGLTEERVRYSNKACAALFRWYASSIARAEAALALLVVDAEIESLRLSSRDALAGRWRCHANDGWLEYPHDINTMFETSLLQGGNPIIAFQLHDESYIVDLDRRVQRNVGTHFLRPIRPPGDEVDLRALQGSWLTCWGPTVTVQDLAVSIEDSSDTATLELRDGSFHLKYRGEWRLTGGTPLRVTWSDDHGDGLVWIAVAGSYYQ